MKYIPNKISLSDRALNFAASLLLLIYGGYGIYKNDLFMPGRYANGAHLQNEPAQVMYAAFICGVLVMLSVIVDHYDERDNENKYLLFANILKHLGWGLFGVALI